MNSEDQEICNYITFGEQTGTEPGVKRVCGNPAPDVDYEDENGKIQRRCILCASKELGRMNKSFVMQEQTIADMYNRIEKLLRKHEPENARGYDYDEPVHQPEKC